MKKILFLSNILALLILLIGCDKKEEQNSKESPKPVKIMKINKSDDYIVRQFPGQVHAGRDSVLSFKVSGVLIDLAVKKGQEILKGNLIGSLDPVDFEYKVNEQQAKYDESQSLYEKYLKLKKQDYISKAEYEKQKAERDMALANLNLAKQNLKDTKLYAPYSGIIADTYPEKYQRVKEYEPVALLYDLKNIDVAIDVPENIMINIDNNNTKDFNVIFNEASKKKYSIEYKKHISNADEATNTYRVYFTLAHPEGLTVLKGMTATVQVKIASKNNKDESYNVPAQAVFTDESNNNYVWKINPETNRVTKTKVDIVNILGNKIRITKGITANDKIVTAGTHLLQENDLVTEWEN